MILPARKDFDVVLDSLNTTYGLNFRHYRLQHNGFNLNEFESIEGGTMDRDRISYLSIGKNYDDKLQFEIRAREDGRQLKLSYLLN